MAVGTELNEMKRKWLPHDIPILNAIFWADLIIALCNMRSEDCSDFVVVLRTMLCNGAIFETMTTPMLIVTYSLLTALITPLVTVNPNTPPEIISN